jgi:hypothetical protein
MVLGNPEPVVSQLLGTLRAFDGVAQRGCIGLPDPRP